MPRTSAGLLMFRRRDGTLEVLLVHPGGPFWAKKDLGAWTIPKGELEKGEDPLATARREFQEETGMAPSGPFHALGSIKQKAGKIVHAWAFEGDIAAETIKSNTVKVEWPPRSGRWSEFPEVDRAEWFRIDDARRRLNPAQVPFLDHLVQLIKG
jgi:predicted NUDIX family NTP pyrophosphohydrolase